eukprot:scaffold7068_cov301-Pinguiococcus_pyrenoidosus.AAC.4
MEGRERKIDGRSFLLDVLAAIVAYSPGPFGGARVAMAMRPLLSELGCLPVSHITLLADPINLLHEDGTPKGEGHNREVEMLAGTE